MVSNLSNSNLPLKLEHYRVMGYKLGHSWGTQTQPFLFLIWVGGLWMQMCPCILLHVATSQLYCETAPVDSSW